MIAVSAKNRLMSSARSRSWPGQIAVAIEQVSADLHLQAQRLERFLRDIQLHRVERGARRRDQRNRVAGRQPSRLDERLPLRLGRLRRVTEAREATLAAASAAAFATKRRRFMGRLYWCYAALRYGDLQPLSHGCRHRFDRVA